MDRSGGRHLPIKTMRDNKTIEIEIVENQQMPGPFPECDQPMPGAFPFPNLRKGPGIEVGVLNNYQVFQKFRLSPKFRIGNAIIEKLSIHML